MICADIFSVKYSVQSPLFLFKDSRKLKIMILTSRIYMGKVHVQLYARSVCGGVWPNSLLILISQLDTTDMLVNNLADFLS